MSQRTRTVLTNVVEKLRVMMTEKIKLTYQLQSYSLQIIRQQLARVMRRKIKLLKWKWEGINGDSK